MAAIICAMIGMEWCGCLKRNRKTSNDSTVRYDNNGVQVIMTGDIPPPINYMAQPPAYATHTSPPSYCTYDPAALDCEMVARVQASNPGLNVLGWLNEPNNHHGPSTTAANDQVETDSPSTTVNIPRSSMAGSVAGESLTTKSIVKCNGLK